MNHQEIDSVEEAEGFLRQSGLEIIALESGWILRGMEHTGAYLELVCDSHRELIECARREQAIRLGLRMEPDGSRESDWPGVVSRPAANWPAQATLSYWVRRPTGKNDKEAKA
jgi:hypothetical protein